MGRSWTRNGLSNRGKTYLTHWYLSIMYGTLMDEEWAEQQGQNLRSEYRALKLYEIPGVGRWPDGTVRRYLGVVDVSEREATLPGLELGSEISITFTEDEEDEKYMDDDGALKESALPKWKATIIHPLTGLEIAGTGELTLIVHPRGTRDDVKVNTIGSTTGEETMTIRLCPTNSSLSARRKVNAINTIMDSETPAGREMRRFLLARDFRWGTLIPGDKPLGDKPMEGVLKELQGGNLYLSSLYSPSNLMSTTT